MTELSHCVHNFELHNVRITNCWQYEARPFLRGALFNISKYSYI